MKKKPVLLSSVYLDEKNPRHDPLKDQPTIIKHLCKTEKVFALAEDIVAQGGINPLELLGVLDNQNGTYTVLEGNRRVCALKLLHDPDLSPSTIRSRVRTLSEKWTPSKKIDVCVFLRRRDADEWLTRIHGGAQEGRGRTQWNAEQKARHTNNPKNQLAIALLDHAQGLGLITAVEREKKVTTVQRYLGNRVLRASLSIDKDASTADTGRLRKFIGDLKSGEVNSRKNKRAIEDYSQTLAKLPASKVRKNFKVNSTKATPKRATKPTSPKAKRHLPHDAKITAALRQTGCHKLEQLYYSICSIDLKEHTPLLAVGVWSFFESLTARAGRKEATDFYGYLGGTKLEELGFTARNRKKSLQQAIKRVQEFGNTTKHHADGACFSDLQLANDLEVTSPLILALIKKIATE